MSKYSDPVVPAYIKSDLLRLMNRISANEHWYEQMWLGVPVWQMPDDMLRLQEIVVQVRPKWIVETGTKFGGSAIFFASLLKLLGDETGGVVTVDLTQYTEAATTLEEHPHANLVRKALVGDAASPDVVKEIAASMRGNEGCTLVFLDDNHNAEHVYKEMVQYAEFVTPGSYLIVADTVFQDLAGTPVGASTEKYPDVANSNPRVAVQRFLSERSDFVRDERFIGKGMSNFSDGFLRRLV
jgi:cephalosporin hydroxylase